jgi:hypothetical protein
MFFYRGTLTATRPVYSRFHVSKRAGIVVVYPINTRDKCGFPTPGKTASATAEHEIKNNEQSGMASPSLQHSKFFVHHP